MNHKISHPWLVFIIGVTIILFSGIVLSAIYIFGGYFQQDIIFTAPAGLSQSITLPKLVVAGIPVRIKIPKINVDAAIEYVGLTSLGAMAVPKGPDNVGWFELGPRPGNVGSAVVAGHEGWKNNIPAVFDYLYKLQKGDEVYVEDDMGTTTTFMVRKVVIYGENDDASTVFYSNDGLDHLNLITCEGVWNAVTKSYSGRLVVFADKEN